MPPRKIDITFDGSAHALRSLLMKKADLPRRITTPNLACWDARAFRHQGAGCDQRAGLDDGLVQNHGPHAYKTVIAQFAAVNQPSDLRQLFFGADGLRPAWALSFVLS